jgi:hypothetical protein
LYLRSDLIERAMHKVILNIFSFSIKHCIFVEKYIASANGLSDRYSRISIRRGSISKPLGLGAKGVIFLVLYRL